MYASTPRMGLMPASSADVWSSYAPNMFPWSVTATASMPEAFTCLIRSLSRFAPSRREYCVWRCRWTKSPDIRAVIVALPLGRGRRRRGRRARCRAARHASQRRFRNPDSRLSTAGAYADEPQTLWARFRRVKRESSDTRSAETFSKLSRKFPGFPVKRVLRQGFVKDRIPAVIGPLRPEPAASDGTAELRNGRSGSRDSRGTFWHDAHTDISLVSPGTHGHTHETVR